MPEFNPELPHATIRHISGKVRISQGGYLFTKNHELEGPDPNYQPPKEPVVVAEPQSPGMLSAAQEQVDDSRAEIMKRVQQKLSSVPQEIVDAQKENAAARKAEELSE